MDSKGLQAWAMKDEVETAGLACGQMARLVKRIWHASGVTMSGETRQKGEAL